ncbi:MAG: hypothetical protein U0414_03315 [Polyangiaceae bacterium]
MLSLVGCSAGAVAPSQEARVVAPPRGLFAAPTFPDERRGEEVVGDRMTVLHPVTAPTNTPLALYAQVMVTSAPAHVVVRYRAFGDARWQTVEFEVEGDGVAGYVPCDRLTAPGPLKYHVLATDTDGAVLASVGSPKEPLVAQIEPHARAVALPGKRAPTECPPMLEEPNQPVEQAATTAE